APVGGQLVAVRGQVERIAERSRLGQPEDEAVVDRAAARGDPGEGRAPVSGDVERQEGADRERDVRGCREAARGRAVGAGRVLAVIPELGSRQRTSAPPMAQCLLVSVVMAIRTPSLALTFPWRLKLPLAPTPISDCAPGAPPPVPKS